LKKKRLEYARGPLILYTICMKWMHAVFSKHGCTTHEELSFKKKNCLVQSPKALHVLGEMIQNFCFIAHPKSQH
jgi:hypothetical protein